VINYKVSQIKCLAVKFINYICILIYIYQVSVFVFDYFFVIIFEILFIFVYLYQYLRKNLEFFPRLRSKAYLNGNFSLIFFTIVNVYHIGQ